MLYVYLAIAALILLLTLALVIAIKIAARNGKEAKAYKIALDKAKKELWQLLEYQKKTKEAQANADEKKKAIHSGDNAADFAHSLDLLHNAAGGKPPERPAS
ncbi:MAG: hypothetical protein LBK08_10395 [Treponema sp.]|jgi:glucosamine 6-phosphate synthetase-like amidotransferase/phosphosugar isomerase protein|nr:hypothetical protein [Treponema sp.]